MGRGVLSACSAWKVCLEEHACGLDWDILKTIQWPGDAVEKKIQRTDDNIVNGYSYKARIITINNIFATFYYPFHS